MAKDYARLGFGTGWAQAADQVCTLADGFLTVRGERSRFFGPDAATDYSLSSAATNLSSDLYFRGVRDSGTVEKLLKAPAPAGPSHDVKETMRGFAAGYNAWIEQNRITDPACRSASWVRPVTALDVAARGYALAVLGGQGRGIDGITAAQPPTVAPPAAGVTPEEAATAAERLLSTQNADMGSNAVAFDGSTTVNGRGLLLGNPHYPWQGGRRFWQAQQTIPGELNVSGASLLGSTTISIGHNADVAWSHTVATGVTLNLHQLTLDPADPTAYLVDGKRERMTKRTVSVPVKGAADVTRTQWWTRYGPVVTSMGAALPLPWTASTAYALNDPNATNLRMADTGLGFGKARSTGDVERALHRSQGMPWVNTIAADRAGHSFFAQSQVLPRITDELAERCSTPLGRATYPASGLAVLDGSRTDCALGSDPDAVQPGIFGPGRMPVLKNQPYVENSNDSAWLTNAERPLTGYERVFGTIATPRSMRTRGAVEDVALMAERGRLGVKDLQRQQFANRAAGRGSGRRRDGGVVCGAAGWHGRGYGRDAGRRVGGVPGAAALGPECGQRQPGRAALRPVLAEGVVGARRRAVEDPVRSGRPGAHPARPEHVRARPGQGTGGCRGGAAGRGHRAGRAAGRPPVRRAERQAAADRRRDGVAGHLEQDRADVEPGGWRLYGGVVGLQLHPGGRLGRQPLPGGPDAADVLPVGEPEVTAPQRPDPAVRG